MQIVPSVFLYPPMLRDEYENAVSFGLLRENKRQALVERSLPSHVVFLRKY